MAKLEKTHELKVSTGEYTLNGETKKRYVTVGSLFKYEDGGLTIKLDSIPISKDWDGFVSVFKYNPNKLSILKHSASQANNADAEKDDIPF